MELKAKVALGTGKKVTGRIQGLTSPCSFKNLKENLGGKILVCLGKLSKDVLEKARALGVLGIVCQEIDEAELERLKKELSSSWSPALFGFLVIDGALESWLNKIEGKEATISIEKRKLTITV